MTISKSITDQAKEDYRQKIRDELAKLEAKLKEENNGRSNM